MKKIERKKNVRKIRKWLYATFMSIFAIVTVLTTLSLTGVFTPSSNSETTKTVVYDDDYFNNLLLNRIPEANMKFTAGAKDDEVILTGVKVTTEFTAADFKTAALVIPETTQSDKKVVGIDLTGDAIGAKAYIKAVVIPKTVETITSRSFWGFGDLEYFKTPFIGTNRGSSANSMNPNNTPETPSKPFVSMFSNPNEITDYAGSGDEAIEVSWYDTVVESSSLYKIPSNLQRIEVYDDYQIGNHALFNLPVSSIKITASELNSNAVVFGVYAISECVNLKSVELPSTNTVLSEGILAKNDSLTEITLPANTTVIPKGAFALCPVLKDVKIPTTVTHIEDGAFSSCPMLTNLQLFNQDPAIIIGSNTGINLPQKLNSIGAEAFKGCIKITNFIVPNEVKTIGQGMLSGCVGLQSVSLPFVGAHRDIKHDGTCNPSSSFYNYHNHFGYIFSLNGNSTADTYVAGQAYEYGTDSLRAIAQYCIPEKLGQITITDDTKIGLGAFQNLKKVTYISINEAATFDRVGIFNGCENLENLIVPNVGSALGYLFAGESFNNSISVYGGLTPGTLKNVTITNQKTILTHTFRDCSSIESVTISKNTEAMQEAIFHGNSSLKTLVLPFVGNQRGEFYEKYWWWRDVAWRNTLQWIFSSSIHSNTYQNNSLKYYDSYIKYIPNTLQNVTINDETLIGTYSFRNFTSLKYLAITNDVSYISQNALAGCKNITELTLPYVGCNSNPHGSAGANYVLGWIFGTGGFASSYVQSAYANYYIPESLKSITIGAASNNVPAYAFSGLKSVSTIIINGEIVQLGTAAFNGCVNLTSLSTPNARYEHVGNYAFQNCQKLLYINEWIPNTVETIGDYAFAGTSVGYNTSALDLSKYSSIGAYAFSNCLQLTSITIPATTTIGEGVFQNCQYLKTVDLQNKNVTKNLFKNCYALEGIDFTGITVIPEGIFSGCKNLKYASTKEATGFYQDPNTTTIGADAFKDCMSFDRYEIRTTTTSIGSWAFSGCTGLEYMTIPRETTKIDSNGWVGCDPNFYFYVYDVVEKWSKDWVDNWNCDYPVYIIGHIDDSTFTYYYDTTEKKYYVTGVEAGKVLSGTINIPSYHNGLKVVGIDENKFTDDDARLGRSKISAHIGIQKVILPKSITKIVGSPFSTGRRVDIYTELTVSEVNDLYESTGGEKGWKIGSIENDYRYASEQMRSWTTSGLFYYKDAWEYGTGYSENVPYIKSSALTFKLDPSFLYFTKYTGKEIIIGIEKIILPGYINESNSYDALVNSDTATIYESTVFAYTYSDNIKAGTAKITCNLNQANLNSYNTTEELGDFAILLKGVGSATYEITKCELDVYYSFASTTLQTKFTETYSGSPWSNSLWGEQVSGLINFPGAVFSGTLETSGVNAGTYDSYMNGFKWATPWSVKRNNVDITDNFTLNLHLIVEIKKMDVEISFTGAEWDADNEVYLYPYIGEYIQPTAVAVKHSNPNMGSVQADCAVQVNHSDSDSVGFYPDPDASFGIYAYLVDDRNYRLVNKEGEPLVNNIILSGDRQISGVEAKYKVVKGKIVIDFNVEYPIGPNENYWSNSTWNSTNISGLGPNSVFEGEMRTSGEEQTSYSWNDATGRLISWFPTKGPTGTIANFHITNSKYDEDESKYYEVEIRQARVVIKYANFEINYYVQETSKPDTKQSVSHKTITDSDRTVDTIIFAVDGKDYTLYAEGIPSDNIPGYKVTYYSNSGATTSIDPIQFKEANQQYFFGVRIEGRHFNTYDTPVRLLTVKSDVETVNPYTKEYDREPLDPDLFITKHGDGQTITINYYNYSDTTNPLLASPSAVGKYKIHIVAADTDYFNECDVWIDAEITKRKIVIDVSGSKKYDGLQYALIPNSSQLIEDGYLLSDDILTGTLLSNSSRPQIYDNTMFSWVPTWQVYHVDSTNVSNNYEIVLEGTYEILPLEFEVTAEGFTGDYDYKFHSIDVVVKTDSRFDDTYKIYYSLSPITVDTSIGRLSTIKYSFSDPGKYQIWYMVVGDNYKTVVGSKEVQINELTITYDDPAEHDGDGDNYKWTIEYDATSHDYKIGIVEPWNAIVSYSTNNGLTWSTMYPSYTNIGDYNVKFKIEAPFYTTVEKSVTVSIEEAKVDLPEANYKINGYEGTYDGKPHSVDVSVTVPIGSDWAKIYYSVDNGLNWTTKKPEYTNRGTYPVAVRISAQGYRSVFKTVEVKILGMNIDVIPEETIVTFDNQYHNLNIKANSGTLVYDSDTKKITYNGVELSIYYTTNPHVADADSGWIANLGGGFKDVGIYNVYYKLTADNYEDKIFDPCTLTISPLKDAAATFEYQIFEYRKEPIPESEIKIDTVHDGIRNFYYYAGYLDGSGEPAYDSSTAIRISNPQELGVYFVHVEFLPSKNCGGITVDGFIRIEPKKLEVKWESEVDYDGTLKSPNPYVETGTSDTINLLYQLNDGSDEPIEVGKYKFSVSMLQANPNYVLDRDEIEMVISKRKVFIQFEDEKEYNEKVWTHEESKYYNKIKDSWINLGITLLPNHKFVATMQTNRSMKTTYYYTTLSSEFYINSVSVVWDIILIDKDGDPVLDTGGNQISVKDYYDVGFDITVKILNPSIDLSDVVDTEVFYDGYAHSINLNLPSGLSGVQIFYKAGIKSWFVTPITYTLAGEYTIEYFVRATGYEDTYGVSNLIIKKSDLNIELDNLKYQGDDGSEIDNDIYNAKEHTNKSKVTNVINVPEPNGENGHLVYYSAADYSYEEVAAFYKEFSKTDPMYLNALTKIVDAGSYYCVVYYESADLTWNESYIIKNVVLKQKDIHITIYSGFGPIFVTNYNGDKFSIPLFGATALESDLITNHHFIDINECTVQTISPNAGVYTAEKGFEFGVAMINDGKGNNVAKNYHPVLNPGVQVTINKIFLTDDEFEVSDNKKVYDGSVASPIIKTPSDGKIIYTFYYYNELGNKIACDHSDFQSNVGKYYVEVTIAEGTNYYAWNGGLRGADVIVTPKEVTVVWEKTESQFNGEKQSAVASITDVFGNKIILDVLYYDASGTASSSVIVAGKHEGTATFNAGETNYADNMKNYKLLDFQETFTISKLNLNINLGNGIVDGVDTNNIISYGTQSAWTSTISTEIGSPNPEIVDWPINLLLEGFLGSNPTISTVGSTAGVYMGNDRFSLLYKCYTDTRVDVSDSIEFTIIGTVTICENDITFTTTPKQITYLEGKTYAFEELGVVKVDNPISGYTFTSFKVNGGNPSSVFERIGDVGVYSIEFTIKADGYTDRTGTTSVEIVQRDSFITFTTSISKEYDGTPVTGSNLIKSAKTGFNGNESDLVYTYYERVTNPDGTIVNSPLPLDYEPIDVGKYFLEITSSADSRTDLILNYTPLYASLEFEITPKKLSVKYENEWVVEDLSELGKTWNSGNMEITVGMTDVSTGLISSDRLVYAIQSDFDMFRNNFFANATLYYDGATGQLIDSSGGKNYKFIIGWKINRYEDGINPVKDPVTGDDLNIAKNYYLDFKFNLNVHFPYIDAVVGGVNAFYKEGTSYHGTIEYKEVPKTAITHYFSLNSNDVITGKDCVNEIDDKSISFTKPGTYTVFYKLTATGYEDLVGRFNIVISYFDREVNVDEPIIKEYDGKPAGELISGKYIPSFSLSYDAAVPSGLSDDYDISKLKITYQRVGSVVLINPATGCIDAGTYQYRLVIPASTYFKESVVEGTIEIKQAQLYLVDKDTQYTTTYDGTIKSYIFNPIDPYYKLMKKDGTTSSSLVDATGLNLKGTLVTNSANANVYTGADASLNWLYASYTITDTSGNDLSKNYIVDIREATFKIEEANMVYQDITPGYDEATNTHYIQYDAKGHTVNIRVTQPSNNSNTKISYWDSTKNEWTTKPIYVYEVSDVPKEIQYKIEIPNYKTVEAGCNIQITKADSYIEIKENLTKEYDAQEVAIPSGLGIETNNSEYEKIIYYYFEIIDDRYIPIWDSETEIGNRPINVGKYIIEVILPSTKNYNGSSTKEEFEIFALVTNVRWTDTSLTYNGEVQKPTAYLQLAPEETGTSIPLEVTVTSISGGDSSSINTGYYMATASIADASVKNYIINSVTEKIVYNIFARKITVTANITTGYTGNPVRLKFGTAAGPDTYTVHNIVSGHEIDNILATKSGALGTYTNFSSSFQWEEATKEVVKDPVIKNSTGSIIDSSNYIISYSLKVTINASSSGITYVVDQPKVEYDGKGHSMVVTVTPSTGYTVFYSITTHGWSDTPISFTEVGIHQVNFEIRSDTADEKFVTITGTGTVTIEPKKANIEFVNPYLRLDKIYDDLPVVLTDDDINYVDKSTHPREISFTYYKIISGGKMLVNSAVDAGDYRVVISIAGATNYVNGTMTVDFTISKRDIIVHVKPTSKVYDSEMWSAMINEKTVTGLVSGHTFDGTIQTRLVDVGLYTTIDDFVWHSNYHIFDGKTADTTDPRGRAVKDNYSISYDLEVRITEAQMAVEGVNYVGNYDGNPHTITVNILGTKVIKTDEFGTQTIEIVGLVTSKYKIEYSRNPELYDYTANEIFEQIVGTTTVYYKVSAPNYDPVFGSANIIIYPEGADIPDSGGGDGGDPTDPDDEGGYETGDGSRLIYDAGFIYNGNEYPTPSYSTDSTGAQTVKYYLASDATYSNPLEKAPTDAGDYVFILWVAADPSHKKIKITQSFKIYQKTVSLEWGNLRVPYTGEDQSPTASYTDVKGDKIPIDKIINGLHTNKGSYEVTAIIKDSNYAISNPTKTFVIGATFIDELILDFSTPFAFGAPIIIKDYAGNIYTINSDGIIISIESSDGKVNSDPKCPYKILVDKDPSAGTHDVFVCLLDKENNAWATNRSVEDLSYTYTITPKVFPNPDQDLLYDFTSSWVWTGSAIEPPVKVSVVNFGTTDVVETLTAGVDYEIAYSNNIEVTSEVNKAEILITGKGDYSFTSTQYFSILAAAPVALKLKKEASLIFMETTYSDEEGAVFNETGELVDKDPNQENIYLGHLHQNMTIQQIIDQFENDSKCIKVIDQNGNEVSEEDYIYSMGTGWTIELYDDEKFTNKIDSIQSILFGDLDGSGTITLSDFDKVINVVTGLTTYEDLEIYYYAGILNRDYTFITIASIDKLGVYLSEGIDPNISYAPTVAE